MKIALVGNPNCGKTTLINRITGSHLPVGNRAGVTVGVTEIAYRKDILADLPGIYSLTDAGNEERAARDYLDGEVDLVLNIIDVRYLSRSLLLTSQLLAKGHPVAVVLNMTEQIENRGGKIDEKKLADFLGCSVIKLSKKEKDFSALFSSAMQKRTFYDRLSIAQKYELFDKIDARVVHPPQKNFLSQKADVFLVDSPFAVPVFIVAIALTLVVATAFFGSFLGGLITDSTAKLASLCKTRLLYDLSPVVASLIADGILTGAGGVLSFLPLVLSLFFFLELMESSGFLSRAAIAFDRVLSKAGLSGRSAISFLLGCGCTVPAIASTRALGDENEAACCQNNLHFVPCSAKLPVLACLMSVPFRRGYLFVPLFYLVGAAAIYLSCKADKLPPTTVFLLELPPLRLPDPKEVLSAVGRKCRSFLFKVCTVVFLSSIAVWALVYFDFSFSPTSPDRSILAKLCGYIKYAFLPIGLADWRIAAAFVAGFAGKETVIGVLSVISGGDLGSVFTPFTAVNFALFLFLSPPCAAALSALRSEVGKKKALFIVFRQTAIAYVVCSLNYVLSLLLSLIF